MSANYDNSAWFYDRLSRVIYGKALIKSQVYLLGHIPEKVNILIVGGGTGWILEEISKLQPSGLQITYVEISAKMMALSRKRDVAKNTINYINEPIENITDQIQYDVVISPFLFDNFTEQTLKKVFAHIRDHLEPGGVWLNTDFQLTGKWWQKVLLECMLLFFRIICDVEAKKLPDIKKYFVENHYKVIDQKTFFRDFILSTAYRK